MHFSTRHAGMPDSRATFVTEFSGHKVRPRRHCRLVSRLASASLIALIQNTPTLSPIIRRTIFSSWNTLFLAAIIREAEMLELGSLRSYR